MLPIAGITPHSSQGRVHSTRMVQERSSLTNWRAPTAAIRLVFLTIGIIVLLLLAWIGRVIVVLLFAAAIVAVLVSAVVDWLRATLRTRREFAFLLFLFGAALLILLTLWIKGPDIIEQFADLQTD